MNYFKMALLFALSLSFTAQAKVLMTRAQIEDYKAQYDKVYDESVQTGLTSASMALREGRAPAEVLAYCDNQREIHDKMATGITKDHQNYYSMIGSLNGRGDGRREGCRNAVAVYLAQGQERNALAQNDKKSLKINIFSPDRLPSSESAPAPKKVGRAPGIHSVSR